MGTHPIFESDFDCLTDLSVEMPRRRAENQPQFIRTRRSAEISVKVVGQDGSVVPFRIEKNLPLRQIMQTYCYQQGLEMSMVRFHFSTPVGPCLVKETDTALRLKMKDGTT